MERDELEQFVDEIKQYLEVKFSQLPTKAFVEDLFLNGKTTAESMIKKEDAKVNRLSEILAKKNVLTDSEFNEFSEYRIF